MKDKIQYKIIDNFLPKENFKAIKSLMFSDEFNWFYRPDVNFTGKDSSNMLFYFTHVFYSRNIPNSPFFNFIQENLLSFIKMNSLIRVKGNLYPNQGIKKINGSHVDYEFTHRGAIFYLNTNNGKTLLNDKIKIDSVENRILYFDPSIKHDSENCTDQKVRMNININYF
jgi:hypothetical protein